MARGIPRDSRMDLALRIQAARDNIDRLQEEYLRVFAYTRNAVQAEQGLIADLERQLAELSEPNVVRVLDPDEEPAALARFRPLP